MSVTIDLAEEPESQQIALLRSLKTGHYDEFVDILKRNLATESVDINHVYGDPENKTLLDIACSDTNKAAFVQVLLNCETHVNQLNRAYGAAPIHFAVSTSDYDTVRALVLRKRTDIHVANVAGKTAFHLAAQNKRKDVLRLLRQRQYTDIELAKVKFSTSSKAEEGHIRTVYNPFKEPKRQGSFAEESLAASLHRGDYEAFASKATEANVRTVDPNLEYTFLQYACKLGYTKFVQLLLELNVDPNEITDLYHWPPITIAAFYGYHQIVQLLLDTCVIELDPQVDENILHSLMNGLHLARVLAQVPKPNDAQGAEMAKTTLCDGDHRDYLKCLKLILNNVPDSQLDVNLRDFNGQSPLFWAIRFDNRDMIQALLERGAYIQAPSWLHRPAIQYIKPATLEYFLNRSVKNVWTTATRRYTVELNYNLLASGLHSRHVNETQPLLALCEAPELKPLLKHPFFAVFLDFKWHILVRKIYYINLAFYLQFVVFLSLYLLAFDYAAAPKHNPTSASVQAVTLWYIILTGNSVMLVREFSKLIIYSKATKYRYIMDPRNWMEVTLIVITYVILFCEIQSNQIRACLATTAIFLSYVELILLILSHPRMCVRIEMFKAVALNSLKFIVSYLILILAFAFSFYILFKDANSTSKSFQDISQALFKTLLMSTGEYELSDILVNDEYGISRLVIVLFIFLIPTVLFNLLNAIAVSDIQAIRKDAELVSIVVRVKFIAHMEEVIQALLSFVDRVASCGRAMTGRQLGPTPDERLRKQNYYTNYFGTTCNRTVVFNTFDGRCAIDKHDGLGTLKFSVSPFTQQSIRERLYAETGEEEDPSHTTDKETGKAATLQKICKNQETLKNALEKLEDRLQIIELKLTENTKVGI